MYPVNHSANATWGKVVTTLVVVTRQGDNWVASGSDPGNARRIIFRETQLGLGGLGLTGTMHGNATDLDRPPIHTATGTIVSVSGDAEGGSAMVTGVGTPDSPNAPSLPSVVGIGRAAGRITFNDSAGEKSATCTAVHWSLAQHS